MQHLGPIVLCVEHNLPLSIQYLTALEELHVFLTAVGIFMGHLAAWRQKGSLELVTHCVVNLDREPRSYADILWGGLISTISRGNYEDHQTRPFTFLPSLWLRAGN